MPRLCKGAPGFQKLKGKLVYKVNNRACNVVSIETGEGLRYEIEVETNFLGVPTLRLSVVPPANSLRKPFKAHS